MLNPKFHFFLVQYRISLKKMLCVCVPSFIIILIMFFTELLKPDLV